VVSTYRHCLYECRRLRDPEELQDEIRREQEERQRKEHEKEHRKEEERRKLREKEELARVPPTEYFKRGNYESQFSAFDERGLPTHLASGSEIGTSKRKKLDKELSAHITRHQKQLEIDRRRSSAKENGHG